MFSPTGLPFYPDYELLFLLKPDLELQYLFCTLRIFELLHLILVPLSNYIPTVTFRGVLGSVSVSLYRYGQPKPNISVCEILNRNRPKLLTQITLKKNHRSLEKKNHNIKETKQT